MEVVNLDDFSSFLELAFGFNLLFSVWAVIYQSLLTRFNSKVDRVIDDATASEAVVKCQEKIASFRSRSETIKGWAVFFGRLLGGACNLIVLTILFLCGYLPNIETEISSFAALFLPALFLPIPLVSFVLWYSLRVSCNKVSNEIEIYLEGAEIGRKDMESKKDKVEDGFDLLSGA